MSPMFLDFLAIFMLVLVMMMLVTAITSLLIQVPFVPSQKKVIEKIISKINIQKGQTIYDLGCGDGRLLFAIEKKTKIAGKGYEIAPMIYLIARIKKWLLASKVEVYRKNFFSENLSDADHIFCYLTPQILEKVGKKIKKECKKGTNIISHTFKIKGLKPKKIIRKTRQFPPIYFYKLK